MLLLLLLLLLWLLGNGNYAERKKSSLVYFRILDSFECFSGLPQDENDCWSFGKSLSNFRIIALSIAFWLAARTISISSSDACDNCRCQSMGYSIKIWKSIFGAEIRQCCSKTGLESDASVSMWYPLVIKYPLPVPRMFRLWHACQLFIFVMTFVVSHGFAVSQNHWWKPIERLSSSWTDESIDSIGFLLTPFSMAFLDGKTSVKLIADLRWCWQQGPLTMKMYWMWNCSKNLMGRSIAVDCAHTQLGE